MEGEVTAESVSSPSVQDQEIEMLSIISDLNVRNTPGKDGVIVDKLSYGQRAIFLNEETDFKEKIIMRGQPRFDSWKKIRFSGSLGKGATDGWVYGGGMILKDEAYEKLDSTHYRRSLAQVTGDEVSGLLEIDVILGEYSSGFIDYELLPKSNLFNKDGEFEIINGISKRLESESDFGSMISGIYTHGQPEGEIVKVNKGNNHSYKSTLYFENGICLWGSIIGTYEGHDIDFRTEKPSECSFSYLEKALQP